jgi:hypothetical protein
MNFTKIVTDVNQKYSYNWSLEEIYLAIKEFKRFLSLKVQYNDFNHILFSPGPVIDNIWHEFLLHPQEYYDYCMLLSNKIINHNPNIDKNVITRYNNTKKYYKIEFGEDPPVKFWPNIQQNIQQNIQKNIQSEIVVVVYVIDKITTPGEIKKIKINTPIDITCSNFSNYVINIIKPKEFPEKRIVLSGENLSEYDLFKNNVKMKDLGMKNGSQYELVYIDRNYGC